MNSIKYVGLDVHQSTISVAVLDGDGKLVMQCVLATQAPAIVDFFAANADIFTNPSSCGNERKQVLRGLKSPQDDNNLNQERFGTT